MLAAPRAEYKADRMLDSLIQIFRRACDKWDATSMVGEEGSGEERKTYDIREVPNPAAPRVTPAKHGFDPLFGAIWGPASGGLLSLNQLTDAKDKPGNREEFIKERLERAKSQLQARETEVKKKFADVESGMEQNGNAYDAEELFVIRGQLKSILTNIKQLATLDSIKELVDDNLGDVLEGVGEELREQFERGNADVNIAKVQAQQAAQRKAQQAAQLAAPPVESKEGVLSAALGL